MWNKTDKQTKDGNMIYKNSDTGEIAQEIDTFLVALPGERVLPVFMGGNHYRIEQARLYVEDY